MNKIEMEGQVGQVLAGYGYHDEGKGKTETQIIWDPHLVDI